MLPTMSTAPLVSVIMPAFNTAQYIGEAVDSVIAQSWSNWELIIIDDGSTDGTRDILQTYHDRRISIVEQENRGVSAARNLGLKQARGEFVTFLDSDDALPPKSLEARAMLLVNNRAIDIVDGIIVSKDENLEHVARTYTPYYRGPLLPRLLMLDDRVFFGPFYMVRSAHLSDLAFPVTMSHAEDLLFFTQAAYRRNLQYAFVDEEIYYYRGRPGSAMSDIAGLQAGYLAFMQTVFLTLDIGALRKLFLRLKVSKIMFLTWLSRGRYRSAFVSVFKCVFHT